MSNQYCPRCLNSPPLFRDGPDAFCVFCGYRLSYLGKERHRQTLAIRHGLENEVKLMMSRLAIPIKEVKR